MNNGKNNNAKFYLNSNTRNSEKFIIKSVILL